MSFEIETKVLDIDPDKIESQLDKLGAKKLQKTKLEVSWFRIDGIKEGEDPWFLRIRSNDQGKHEVTWKAKSTITGISRKHKEINFFVAEPEKLSDLFEELGLENYAFQEKFRTTFLYQDWRFDIDQYPHMPTYMEIEGNSEDHIKEAITLLNLNNKETWPEGERTLIQKKYNLDWYHMKF